MSSSYITISYHIILYLMFFYFISSADLISNSTWFQIDLIWFDSILLNLIYYIVQYCISYQWMICVYLSICLSVRLSVCLSVWISLCFLFSPVSLFFLYSFFSLFIFISLSLLFSYELLPHTHTDTDTQIHMNICSFLWLVHITSKGCKWRIVFEW